MNVTFHDAADGVKLESLMRREPKAKQRDRYRCALLAARGEQTLTIMQKTGRSRDFVQTWAYVYRDKGVEGVMAGEKPRPGRPVRLARQHEAAFKARITGGPTAADGGVCTLRGRDAVRILNAEFGVAYTLNGAYELMHRLGLSCLKPRPRHRKNDKAAMAKFLESAPLLSAT